MVSGEAIADIVPAAEEAVNTTTDIATELFLRLGSIGNWLQAIGFIIVLWLIFQIINWILNRKRVKKLDSMRSDLDRIEKKIDKLLKKK